jgi:hypothetical protein
VSQRVRAGHIFLSGPADFFGKGGLVHVPEMEKKTKRKKLPRAFRRPGYGVRGALAALAPPSSGRALSERQGTGSPRRR